MPDNKICQENTTCRICGTHKLIPVLDLGKQCLASIFETGTPPDWLKQPYPLELVRCGAPDGCGLVQLRHSISPQILYRNYGYRSGINERMRHNLVDIARIAEHIAGLRAGDTVCDIGCNDGTLLESFRNDGVDRLGIDPAENVIRFARKKGLDVTCDFFPVNTNSSLGNQLNSFSSAFSLTCMHYYAANIPYMASIPILTSNNLVIQLIKN